MGFIMLSNSKSQDAYSPDKISYRPATVAGSFYPSDKNELSNMLDSLLAVNNKKEFADKDIISIIAPHAGYVYSGGVAGAVYSELNGRKYDAVIIISPSHHKYFRGSSVFSGDAYVTPLGNALVDKDLAVLIANHNPYISYSLDGHQWTTNQNEHAIEVQIPFIQKVLPDTKIVPIVMGSQDELSVDKLAQALLKSIKYTGKKVLIVASTDLSHYHPYDTASTIDEKLIEYFSGFDYFAIQNQTANKSVEACGAGPMIVAMMVAEGLGYDNAIPIKYLNSGDTKAGMANKNRVVGYMSAIISNSVHNTLLPLLDNQSKKILIELAKKSVHEQVKNINTATKQLVTNKLKFSYPNTVFVTLKIDNELRACMGHLYPTSTLLDEIIQVAKTAATDDYRFGPVRQDELSKLEYEITILSRMQRVFDTNKIEIGKDGLLIRLDGKKGLLLPQVASERNWNIATFLNNLCVKAGLRPDDWKNENAQLFKFQGLIINENK